MAISYFWRIHSPVANAAVGRKFFVKAGVPLATFEVNSYGYWWIPTRIFRERADEPFQPAGACVNIPIDNSE